MVMIERTQDADRIYEIARKAYPRDPGRTSIDRFAGREDTYCLVGEFGALLCFPQPEPGVYSLTLLITPSGRGSWGKEFTRAAFNWMFTEGPAQVLSAQGTGMTAEAIRLAYQPPGGNMERVDRPTATIAWEYRRENWKGQ